MSAPADMRLVLSLAAKPGISGYKMHNAGYKALDLNYFYLPRRYNGEIAHALQAMRIFEIRGMSLTMPFKQTSLPHLDALSPEAQAIGAVNTVVNNEGVLTGHNTDAPAAQKLIERYLPWQNHPLVILGAGGMAHAFAYTAMKLGVQGFVCARDTKKAKILAEKFTLQTLPWGDWDALSGAALCNATPIGMKDIEFSVPEAALENISAVFDAVASASTPLVQAAKARLLPTVSGDMLALEQACLQFELYTGMPAPADAMKEALYA